MSNDVFNVISNLLSVSKEYSENIFSSSLPFPHHGSEEEEGGVLCA